MFSPLHLKFHASKWLIASVFIVLLLAWFAIFLTKLALSIQLVLVLLSLVQVCVWLRTYVWLRGTNAIIGLRWLAKHQQLSIQQADGQWRRVAVLRHCYFNSFGVVLQFCCENQTKTRSLLILCDSCQNKQAYRRLQVFARFAKVSVLPSL